MAALVIVGIAGLVLWLTFSADETMEGLRKEADRQALQAELVLPSGALSPLSDGAPQPQGAPQDSGEPPLAAEPSPEPVEPPPTETATATPDGGVVPDAAPEIEAEPDAAATADQADEDLAPAVPPGPDPDLIEASPVGNLPRIGPDGRQPWQAYAQPFDTADTRPRIAIVVTELGLSEAPTRIAVEALPAGVTLAFAPYAEGLDAWISAARAAGHEALLMVPMEPNTYPTDDPGPHTLLTNLPAEDNASRLEWLLGRATGYVGIVNIMGSRFTETATALRPSAELLASRGLMFLDARTSPRSVVADVGQEIGLPVAVSDRDIGDNPAAGVIDQRLAELEALARDRGAAVATVQPYPVAMERLNQWLATLEGKDLVLAPITALVRQEADGTAAP
ncbi:MAG: divergent polysaccharide deacetylase family protein [Inquilinaceae bacterium]